MKQIVLMLLAACSIFDTYPQLGVNVKEFYHYVFPGFTEEMIFLQTGTYLALDKTAGIDTDDYKLTSKTAY